MRTARGRLAGLLIGVATAIVIIAVAILPFLSPAWVGFEQDRAEAAAWTGFAPADLRTATNAILHDWSSVRRCSMSRSPVQPVLERARTGPHA